jgi:hypothetical protein
MSIEITPALLSDLRQKAEAATPGPWKWKNENGSFSVEGPIRKNRYYDSNYIAAASPAVVLALVAEVERLRDRLDALECPNCGNPPKFCVCEVEPLSGNENNFVTKKEANNADQA